MYRILYSVAFHQEKEAAVLNLEQGSLLPVQMAEIQNQEGGCDCGLFAMAIVTALAFHRNPSC